MAKWGWKGNDSKCPVCGLTYKRLKTGVTYADVRMLLWVGSDNPEDWKYKRRHTVLGLWFQIKQGMWAQHLEECEKDRMYKEAKERLEIERAELLEVLGEEVLDQAEKECWDDFEAPPPADQDLSDVPF